MTTQQTEMMAAADMDLQMAWGRLEIEEMMIVGQAECRRINGLLDRDGGVAAARATVAIDAALAPHPEIIEAVVARRMVARAALAAADQARKAAGPVWA